MGLRRRRGGCGWVVEFEVEVEVESGGRSIGGGRRMLLRMFGCYNLGGLESWVGGKRQLRLA